MKVRRVDFYPDEWLAGTRELSAIETGVYITICALIYSRGGPIKADGLARLCNVHGNAFRTIINRLLELGKIVGNDGQIDVKRCAKELENARKRGRKWAEKQREYSDNNDIAEARTETDSRTHVTTNDQPSTKVERPNGRLRARLVAPANDAGSRKVTIAALEPEFDRIWELFPRKRDRGRALRAFIAARKTTAFEVIEAGIRQFAAECAGQEPRYIAHPASWLNGQRWLDDTDKPHGGANGSPRPGSGRKRSPVDNLYAGFAEAAQGDRCADRQTAEPLLDV